MSLRSPEAIAAQPNKGQHTVRQRSGSAAMQPRRWSSGSIAHRWEREDAGKLVGTRQAGLLRHANYNIRRECAKGI